MKKNTRSLVSPAIVLALLAIVVWVLQHQLRVFHYHDLTRSIAEIPRRRLCLALVLTALSYLVLTGYDVLAVHYIRHPLRYGKTALASFISYVFSYNIGLSILGSSAVRYRFYSAWGLSAAEISKVVAFCTLSFWIGVLSVAGVALLFEPSRLLAALPLPFWVVRGLGVILLGLVAAYLVWSAARPAPLKLLKWEFPLPSTPFSLGQIGLSTLDWCLVGSICYVLLPSSSAVSYPAFLGIFVLAHII
jgi:uncharacterized membrane protein YbhN (UPF0104 family)